MIVTLTTPGQQLPVAFRRYVCGTRLDIINGYALCDVPLSKLSTLAQFVGIHRVHYNRDAHESDLLSSVAVQADVLAQTYGYSGAGVDGGLHRFRPDAERAPRPGEHVRSQVRGLRERPEHDSHDENGHGTHVAGIIAGNGAATRRSAGIAPGAKVVSLKVLDDKRQGHDRRHHRGARLGAREPSDVQHPRRQHVGRRRRLPSRTGPTR